MLEESRYAVARDDALISSSSSSFLESRVYKLIYSRKDGINELSARFIRDPMPT